MTAKPYVTQRQAREAMARIAARHRDADSPLAESEESGDVITFVGRLPVRELRGDATHHDVTDALTIKLWRDWDGDVLEVRMLEAAEQLGLNRKRVGRVFGMTSGQGLVDRRTRKRAVIDAAVHATRAVDTRLARSQQEWLVANRRRLADLVASFGTFEELLGDDAVAAVRELGALVTRSGWGADVMAGLYEVLEELADDPAVAGLPVGHPLARGRRAGSELRAAWLKASPNVKE